MNHRVEGQAPNQTYNSCKGGRNLAKQVVLPARVHQKLLPQHRICHSVIHRQLFSTMVTPAQIIFLTVTFAANKMVAGELTLSAEVTAIELGDSGTVDCTPSNDTWTVQWYHGEEVDDKNKIPSNDSLRIYAINGTLTINEANMNDTGLFTCGSASDVNATVVAEVHVFIMPTYFREGMIIVGINAGLVLTIILCAIYTFFDTRSRERENRRGRRKTVV